MKTRSIASSSRSVPLITAVLAIAASASLHAQPRSGAVDAQAGHGLDVYLSEDALQALYARGLRIGEIEDARVRVGVFFNEQRDLIGIGDASVDVIDPNRRRRWGLSVGPRAYGALLSENRDIFALGLGGKASFYFDADRSTSVSLIAYYAPDIVTFGTADKVTDTSAEFETRLTERMGIYVGYRVFQFDLPEGRLDVDDGLHIGFRGRF